MFFTFDFRANATMFLENQIKKVDTMISGFEQQLVKNDVIPDEPNAIQTSTQQLQVRQTKTPLKTKHYC